MGTHRTTISTKAKTALWSLGAATAAVALAVGAGAASGAPGLDLPIVPGVPALTTTVVTPTDTQGFAPTDDRPASSREFTEEHGGAGGSKGALELVTGDGNGKITFFHSGEGAKLSDFAKKLGYSAFRDGDSTGNVDQFPSLQLTIDPTGQGGFSTLYFEPVYQTGDNAARTSDEWHTYDGTTGLFCSTRLIPGFEANQTRCDNGGAKTLAAISEANPDAVVTGFGFNQGSGNPGIISAVDQLVTPKTTYDFELKEPAVVPTTPTDPDPTTEPEPGNGGGNNGGGHGNNGGGHGNNGGGHGNNGGGHGNDGGGQGNNGGGHGNNGGHGPGKGGDCTCR